MAFTVANVITEVRPLVADTDAGDYRWDDATILARVNSGVEETFALRPDSVISQAVSPPAASTATGDAVPLRDLFKMAIIYFTAWSLLSERSSDKSLRTQALDYRKLYTGLVGV